MNVAYILWLPFGELLHHETDVTGKVFRRCPGNPEWWKERAEILRDYTLPSLAGQTEPMQVWAGIAEETKDICGPALEVLEEFGAVPMYHPAHDATKYGKSVPVEIVIDALKGFDVDTVVFAQLDSDDMFLDDALEIMQAEPQEEGLVLVYRRGYLLNAATGELREYDPGQCPLPYMSRTYTRNYLDNPDAYEAKWNYRVTHPKLLQSTKRRDLPDGRFVSVSHERNTSSTWARLIKRNKLGLLVPDERRAEILRRCGRA